MYKKSLSQWANPNNLYVRIRRLMIFLSHDKSKERYCFEGITPSKTREV